MLRTLPDHHIAPSSVSAASLVDSLVLANRKIVRPNEVPSFANFHYLTAIASELGVFLPAYDPLFMNSLTKFYDGELYEERRRTGKVNHLKIEQPYLTILGGTTPSYLNSFLPEGAWDQGFTSRTLLVYSGEQPFTEIFDEDEDFDRLAGLYNALIADLKLIGAQYGKMEWSRESVEAISVWNRSGLEPVPQHNKLQHYNTRRLAHCIKLCMVSAISRSSEMTITVEDYQRALGWLLDVEARVVDIFHSFGVAGDSAAINDTWDFIFRLYTKEKKPILESRVVNFLRTKVPSHNVMRVLQVMKDAGMLKLEILNGMNAYSPLKHQ